MFVQSMMTSIGQKENTPCLGHKFCDSCFAPTENASIDQYIISHHRPHSLPLS